jgi:hypothetical protein
MLENARKFQTQAATHVLELKDLGSSSVEQEVLRISKEKEKRDRIGSFFTQIVSNTTCKFIMNPDMNEKLVFIDAAKIY